MLVYKGTIFQIQIILNMKLIGIWLVSILTLIKYALAKGNCLLAIDSDIINTPTTYTVTFRPGTPNLQQSKCHFSAHLTYTIPLAAMRLTFTAASMIYPTIPVSCQAAGDTSVYTAISCDSFLTSDPYVIVTGLKPGMF